MQVVPTKEQFLRKKAFSKNGAVLRHVAKRQNPGATVLLLQDNVALGKRTY